MKPLGETIASIQAMINDFGGDVAFKNIKGQYIFANDHWLRFLKLTKDDVIGKTAYDFMSPENAAISEKTDVEAIEKKVPIEFTQTITINNKHQTYTAIKWVVLAGTKNKEPLFVCFISASYDDREKVFALRQTVNNLFNEQFS